MIAALLLFTFAHASQPRCSEVPKETWTINRDNCRAEFKKGPPPPDSLTANQLCTCVADSIANQMSCEELKHYEKDAKFAATTRKQIAKLCIGDVTSHTRPLYQEETAH